MLMLILLFVYFCSKYIALTKLQESFAASISTETKEIIDSEILEEPHVNPRIPMVLGNYEYDIYKATSSIPIKKWGEITYPDLAIGGGYSQLPFDMFGVTLGFNCDDTTEGCLFSIEPAFGQAIPYFAILVLSKKISVFLLFDKVNEKTKWSPNTYDKSKIRNDGYGIMLTSNLNIVNTNYKKIEITRKKNKIIFFNVITGKIMDTIDITGFKVYSYIPESSFVYCGSSTGHARTMVHNLHMTKPNKSVIESFAGTTDGIQPLVNSSLDIKHPWDKLISYNGHPEAKWLTLRDLVSKDKKKNTISVYTTYKNETAKNIDAKIDVISRGGSCDFHHRDGTKQTIEPDKLKTIAITLVPGDNKIVFEYNINTLPFMRSKTNISILASCYQINSFSNGVEHGFVSSKLSGSRKLQDKMVLKGDIKIPKTTEQSFLTKGDKNVIKGFLKEGTYQFTIIGKDVRLNINNDLVTLKTFQEGFDLIKEGFKIGKKIGNALNPGKPAPAPAPAAPAPAAPAPAAPAPAAPAPAAPAPAAPAPAAPAPAPAPAPALQAAAQQAALKAQQEAERLKAQQAALKAQQEAETAAREAAAREAAQREREAAQKAADLFRLNQQQKQIQKQKLFEKEQAALREAQQAIEKAAKKAAADKENLIIAAENLRRQQQEAEEARKKAEQIRIEAEMKLQAKNEVTSVPKKVESGPVPFYITFDKTTNSPVDFQVISVTFNGIPTTPSEILLIPEITHLFYSNTNEWHITTDTVSK
jgi:hypothetical protein